MKKVLFVCYGLGIGGIEKCLVNLINVMPEEQYDIDVLLMNPEYDLKNEITRNVNFIDSFKYVMNTTDTYPEIQKRGGIFKHPITFAKYIIFRLMVKFGFDAWKIFKKLNKEYDIAVAYSHHDYSPKYVIDKVNSNKKILWYHNGAYERSGKEYQNDKLYFDKFDYLIPVSSDCKNIIEDNFDFSHCKLLVLKNICNVDNVLKKALEKKPDSYNNDAINITTIGRLTKEKGADLAIEVCKNLVNKGYHIIWHWVGDGNQSDIIRRTIEKNSLNSVFILEGNQQNPYNYLKSTDIYVQPSYFEAYSTTITEAKILNKSIVTTDVGGMRDQIADGKTGFIVPIDSNEIANAIEELIETEETRKLLEENLEKEIISPTEYFKEYKKTIFA